MIIYYMLPIPRFWNVTWLKPMYRLCCFINRIKIKQAERLIIIFRPSPRLIWRCSHFYTRRLNADLVTDSRGRDHNIIIWYMDDLTDGWLVSRCVLNYVTKADAYGLSSLPVRCIYIGANYYEVHHVSRSLQNLK